MEKPTIPKNEEARLEAVKELEILDTPPETQYDNITQLASYICQTPIAVISLIDKDRQWYKSKIGMDANETPREYSFCGHNIVGGDDFMAIPDTREDPRFKDHPGTLRSEKPLIFYAGVPLKGNGGQRVGTICVIDHKPNKLEPQQKKALISLADQVNRLFDLRIKNNKLRNSKDKLSQQNSLLKNFAGSVSHDLKVPLSNIIVTIDILKSKYGEKLDDSGLMYLNRLKQSSFGMSNYISNILEYYETDNISAENWEPFYLKELLEKIVDMLNIDDNCEVNLPDKNFELVLNRSGLEQILLNLLGNSLKYNDKDKIVIDIDCEEKGSYYQFTITDNGMGIPEEKQDHVFDLFSTATDKDREGKKGNGIGLSTVKKLVNKLGGDISMDSEEGKYTTFTFTVKKQKR